MEVSDPYKDLRIALGQAHMHLDRARSAIQFAILDDENPLDSQVDDDVVGKILVATRAVEYYLGLKEIADEP